MPDQNQQQNQQQDPQNQWVQTNQNTNDNLDMFGWDYDIFENPDVLKIEDWWKKDEDTNHDFDDDIGVDYRNENSFENNFEDTTNNITNTPQPEIVDNPNNNNDLWDFDFSEAIDNTPLENTENNTNNDLWDFDFWSTDVTEDTSPNNNWENFAVYDEPDNPDDYVAPDDIDDDIKDLDEEWEDESAPTDIDREDGNTQQNPNLNNDDEISDDDFLNLDEIQALDPTPEEEEMPPITPQEVDTVNNEISAPETNQETPVTETINNENQESPDIDIDEDEESLDNDDYSNDEYDDIDDTIQATPSNENLDNEIFETDPNKSNIQNKFLELKFETEKIFKLVNKDYDVWFDILWANDDRQKIMYKLFIDDYTIEIQKNITDKLNNSQISHTLRFELGQDSLEIYIDDELLYDEIDDLQDDDNKTKQVIEKLNKFIFLITEEYKKIRKDKKAKEKDNIKRTTFREF